MNRLVPPETGTTGAPAPLEFRLELHESIEGAESVWRRLLDEDGLSTAYQQIAWTSAWQRNIGAPGGVTPFIVAAFDAAGRPALLCPLGRRSVGPLSVAEFLGGKHANLNMMVWRRDVAASLDAGDLARLVARLGRLGPRLDLLMLQNQPVAWEGVANPLRLLPHQPSPSPAFRGALAADFEEVVRSRLGSETRRKLRQKERGLGRKGALAFWRAETDDQRRRVLETFFEQKAARMTELGLRNVFAEPSARAFIAAASLGEGGGAPPIELYAASLDDAVIATFGGIVSGNRFSGMFNSMVHGGVAGDSPGEILLSHVVRMACERGLATFDLGVGDAGYKRGFCNEEEPLFDSVIGLTALGHAAAPLLRARLAAKAAIKRSSLWQSLTSLRRRRGKAANGAKPPGSPSS